MPLPSEIKPEDLEFLGYVTGPNADIAAARAYKIWGPAVYVVDSIRNIPVLYGVYDANWNHVGVVLARTAAEAREEAEKKFGPPPSPLTQWNVDRITTGERIYAVYRIKGLEPTEVTVPPITFPPSESVPTAPTTPTPPEGEIPQKAVVEVRSDPSGARVYVNGKDTSKSTPTTLELDPGAYEIVLKLEGYEDWGTSIMLQAGTNPPIEAKLTKKEEEEEEKEITTSDIIKELGLDYVPPGFASKYTIHNPFNTTKTFTVTHVIGWWLTPWDKTYKRFTHSHTLNPGQTISRVDETAAYIYRRGQVAYTVLEVEVDGKEYRKEVKKTF